MASSSFSIDHSWSYDVFLSFRGKDTRTNFTDHFYHALLSRGIHTFIDDDLPRGEGISPQLLKAIEESRISIIIFSKNYASSRWCLDELVKILECKNKNHQMVWPIFYKVDPSHVRHQTSTFGDAFVVHECKYKDNMERVLLWRKAFVQAANLSGWTFKKGEYESKFINDIVEQISVQVLNRTCLNLAKHPVGIQSCVEEVHRYLGLGEGGCRMVGIWGTAGIGKTTIAKAVYNSIAHIFEGSCFLADVRERSMPHGGLLQLQESLLKGTLGGKNVNLVSVDGGINVIKQRLGFKKVLIILDDVNQLDQLNRLAGATSWFGEASRVIITTKDRGLLTRHGIELIYEVKKLDYQKALELFSWSAFGKNEPPNDYWELANCAISHVQHLPLALTLLGSHLRNESMDCWLSTLDCYEGDPYESIQNILKISYDALAYRVQQVFLDIACFFKGENTNYVIQILQDSNLKKPEDCIHELVQKAIITIENNTIRMHDLLEQMGKDIVHQESPTDPGRRSRLWFHEDVYRVLTENTGSEKVKGIILKWLPGPYKIQLNAKCFSKMKNLELLISGNACLSGEVDYLPNRLRLLDWDECELQSLPSNFHPKELVVFKMPRGLITQLGKGFQNLSKLISLQLYGCEVLTKIPDLSGSPNLKILDLGKCKSLVEVDPSVGWLDKLVTLDLQGCSNLEIFPTRIFLKSLTTFCLKDCRKLERFPDIMGKMELMRTLQVGGSGIRKLPSSISFLTGLESLYAERCVKLTTISLSGVYKLQHLENFWTSGCSKLLTFGNMMNSESQLLSTSSDISQEKSHLLAIPNLRSLRMTQFNLSESDFLVPLDCLWTLTTLDLSGNNFESIPVCITKFVNLRTLKLSGCKKLRDIPELPPNVEVVNVYDCTALKSCPNVSIILEQNVFRGLRELQLMNCRTLCGNHGFDEAKMECFLMNQLACCRDEDFAIVLPGNQVPKWFKYREHPNYIYIPSTSEEDEEKLDICEVSIGVPPNSVKVGLALCTVFEVTQNNGGLFSMDVDIMHNGRFVGYRTCIDMTNIETESTHVSLNYFNVSLNGAQSNGTCQLILFWHRNGDARLSLKSCGFHIVDNCGVMTLDNNDLDQKKEEQEQEQEQWLSSSLAKRPRGVAGEDNQDLHDWCCTSSTSSESIANKRNRVEEEQTHHFI